MLLESFQWDGFIDERVCAVVLKPDFALGQKEVTAEVFAVDFDRRVDRAVFQRSIPLPAVLAIIDGNRVFAAAPRTFEDESC